MFVVYNIVVNINEFYFIKYSVFNDPVGGFYFFLKKLVDNFSMEYLSSRTTIVYMTAIFSYV